MKFRITDESDYDTLKRWIDLDFFHHGKMDAKWWMPGSLHSYCFSLEDDKGTVFFLRMESEKDLCRIHIQFGPENEVTRFRVAKALVKIFNPIVDMAKEENQKGIIFQSTNDPLIGFLKKKGFVSCGNDDYLLQLSEV